MLQSKLVNIHIRTLSNQDFSVILPISSSVITLKERINDHLGISVNEQAVIYGGRQLRNEFTLSQYKITDNSSVHILRRALPKINIKTISGPNFSIKIPMTSSVLALKKIISNKFNPNIPISKQTLMFHGRSLQNECSLSQYGIKDGSFIFLSISTFKIAKKKENEEKYDNLLQKTESQQRMIQRLQAQINYETNNYQQKLKQQQKTHQQTMIQQRMIQRLQDQINYERNHYQQKLKQQCKEIKQLKQKEQQSKDISISLNRLRVKRKLINKALVLIICIPSYSLPNTDIPNTNIDHKNMTNLFEKKFKYKTISNKTGYINKNKLNGLLMKTRSELTKNASIYDGMIAILSCHGNDDSISTSDNNITNIAGIKQYFNGNSIPSFVNKMKLFIFDTCRGSANAVPILNDVNNSNNHNNNNNIENDSDGDEADDIDMNYDMFQSQKCDKKNKHHPDKNMMTIYCNSKGYGTSDTKQGGYLINAVNDVLTSDMIQRCDLMRLSERIKRRVSQKSKQLNCAEVHSTEMDFQYYFPANTY